ncbi:hypothetical protein MNV49_006302 [Pseudohyphozyma bogoriensis]|nr:hypothetical protein MNV49_006302 [Pseudohyphozyma bogoriensis]
MGVATFGRLFTAIFMAAALGLFIACSVSVPLTRLAFLSYTFANETELRIGMWGSCTWTVGVDGTLSGQTCSGRGLGFLVDLQNLPGRVNTSNPYVVGNLSKALVTYPIAAGLAFLSIVALALRLPGLALQVGGLCNVAGFLRTDGQVREAFYPNVVGGLASCCWIGLSGAILAGVGSVIGITGTYKETREHGSLIREKEKAAGV